MSCETPPYIQSLLRALHLLLSQPQQESSLTIITMISSFRQHLDAHELTTPQARGPNNTVMDLDASMQIYEEFLAEQAEEVAKETQEVEDEVSSYEIDQLVTRELEDVVSYLSGSAWLLDMLTLLFRIPTIPLNLLETLSRPLPLTVRKNLVLPIPREPYDLSHKLRNENTN